MSIVTRESRNIFSENPIVFMLDLQDAIRDGFRVENTIPGFPSLNAILKEVRMFRPETADLEPTTRLVDTTVTIQNYDAMFFLLDVQSAILQGYEVDAELVRFDSPRVCRLNKFQALEELTEADLPVTQEPEVKTPRTTPRKKKGAK